MLKAGFEIVEGFNNKVFVINGIVDENAHLLDSNQTGLELYLQNQKAINLITDCNFSEIANHFDGVNFECYPISNWGGYVECEIVCRPHLDLTKPLIRLQLLYKSWAEWGYPWSIAKFADVFEQKVNEYGGEKVLFLSNPDDILDGFGIEYFSDNYDYTIRSELYTATKIIEKILAETVYNLLNDTDGIVSTCFQFPDEIKTASKQYLVYFAQFLSDIGIAADTEIKEQLNRTLFKVIPNDGRESLDRIREALTIYINVPSDEEAIRILRNNDNLASSQYLANIMHLKSQLLLANSTIQMKDTTIELLKLSNYEFQKKLESSQQEKNTEDVIKGVLSVKEYDGKFFKLHLPEILRRLKRKK